MSLERILYVDLTERKTEVKRRREVFARYLGGAGVASKLLLEECPPRSHAFSPEAPIIFATGPLVGIFPCMSKTVAMFKSPLTGNLGESHAGGNLSTALRFSGYGAIVVRGASDTPVSLEIRSESSQIEDASSIWGLSPSQIAEQAGRPHLQGIESVVTIGRAGENLVHYGAAVVDRYHHFGRLGLGATMGSKKLKAIYVRSMDNGHVTNSTELKSVYEETRRRVEESSLMGRYRDLGTLANVLELNELRCLPSKNFSKPAFEEAEGISGERFAEQILERKTSCASCPIACVHLGNLRRPSAGERDQKEHPSKLVPYNYEPVFALGSNLNVSDAKGVLSLIAACEDNGLDAIMTGACLAWATEAYESCLITSDETGGLRPRWGDVATYLEMIENLANVRNPFYVALARGVDSAAEEYGGKEFAISLGKNSPAGYFTGYGALVGTLVGSRHSHLSNEGYEIDQVAMTGKVSPERIVEFLVEEEDWLNVLNSLVACYFSRNVYEKELVVKALSAIGIEQTKEQLMMLGKEIFHNLYTFKIREGFDLKKEQIPKRLLETKTPAGYLNSATIRRMISCYVMIRENEVLSVTEIG